MAILAALGGTKWLTEWVPYASHMIFELYQNRHTKENFVRVLYQGQPLSFEGCNSGIYSLFSIIPNSLI